ncbi:MAG: class D sortase [Candidatus Gracilibacteria bacterium]
MPSKKTSKKKFSERTREIEVLPEKKSHGQEDKSILSEVTIQNSASKSAESSPESFDLKLQVPHAAHEVLIAHKNAGGQTPAEKSHQPQGSTNLLHQQQSVLHKPAGKLEIKIWNTLEWIATSALIFAVLFFVMNFNAYSTLFMDKLNRLRGDVQTNPIIQNLTHSAGATQQPLPIAQTADQSKKQVPYLNLEIAPPDDRVIIPRIDKNVPIVKVSTENLIKRDWGGLEADIQEALRYGVVHYPGTAEPGENGNVVVTGHSSYFSWDPGRFKDVFALLHEVVVGDTVIVYHNQKKYFYQVYETKVVTPDKIDILTQRGENRLTLITCTPVGTNLKRLVIFAKPTN